MKRLFAFVITGTLIATVMLVSTGCGSGEPEETEEQTQTATVSKGDISVEITSVGNLDLSVKEELTFETTGTVKEILVDTDEAVEEGQLLATLAIDDKVERIADLEQQIEEKTIDLEQAEITLNAAQRTLDQTPTPDNPGNAIYQAEIEVVNARIALRTAETNYDRAKANYEGNWTVVDHIDQYEKRTAELAIAQLDLEEAEKALDDINSEIATTLREKQHAVTVAEKNADKIREEITDFEKDIEDLMSSGTEITAPFAGYITEVKISEGDTVNDDTVAFIIADSSKFETEVLVSETDIFQIQVGAEAWVEIDALNGLSYPATVTYISPSATVQSGVVNFKVKVELQSLDAMMQEQQAARQEAAAAFGNLQEGEIPERLRQAIDAGMMTEEQVDEMMERIQEGGGFFGQGNGEGAGQFGQGAGGLTSNAGPGTMVSITAGQYQLREGLTATTNIVASESLDTLVVPVGAVQTRGLSSYVTVVLADGSTEERTVQTGISDWQNTEILSGLEEGETVIVTNASSSSSSTSTFQGPGGGGVFFGGGGLMR